MRRQGMKRRNGRQNDWFIHTFRSKQHQSTQLTFLFRNGPHNSCVSAAFRVEFCSSPALNNGECPIDCHTHFSSSHCQPSPSPALPHPTHCFPLPEDSCSLSTMSSSAEMITFWAITTCTSIPLRSGEVEPLSKVALVGGEVRGGEDRQCTVSNLWLMPFTYL